MADAAVDRRQPRAARPPTAHRVVPARAPGGHRRARRARSGRSRQSRRILPSRSCSQPAAGPGPARPGVHCRVDTRDGCALRALPRTAQHPPDLLSTLKGQAGQPSGARGAARFRASLATLQVALSMLLLVAAGLFTRSLMNVSRVNLGVRIDNVITFGISPELNGYTPEKSRVLFEQLEDELAAQPGVTGVTASVIPLLAGSNWGSSVASRAFRPAPTWTTTRTTTWSGRATSARSGYPCSRAASSPGRTSSTRPRSPSSTNSSRRSSISGGMPSASAWRRDGTTNSSIRRSSAWCGTRSTAR